MKGTLILSNKWNKRYLALAEQISTWSKDPSRQIGCVAVGDKGQVLAQGYNGFPRGIEDSPEIYNNRELKYKYIVHAEMNTIFNASYNGVSLDGATLYVHGLPCCSDCAKCIVQVGIKQIFMNKQDVPDTWQTSWDLSQSMFDAAGIKWDFI